MTETIEITKENLETIYKIEDAVCKRLDVNVPTLKTSGTQESSFARSICVYLIFRNTRLTTSEIAFHYEKQENMARMAWESIKIEVQRGVMVKLMECVKHVNNELNLK
jgi:hypothetical protein